MGDPDLNGLDMPALMAIDRAWTVASIAKLMNKCRANNSELFDMISLPLRALDYVSARCML